MLYFVKIEELRAHLATEKRAGKTIGLVPTMGALHAGHLALMKSARECDVVVSSIFVNPLQFNDMADLASYPKNLERDRELMKDDCDILFAPNAEEFYAEKPEMSMRFDLDSRLEGAFRPGHFSGVGIVVSKLLNIVQPDKAYFGLKDLQQYILVKKMVRDLSIPTEIVGCPIVREESGLAMSSRNGRLSKSGWDVASNIYRGLTQAKELLASHSLREVKKEIQAFYADIEGLEIEYFEFVDTSFEVISNNSTNSPMAICVAAYVDGVRLIDNLYLRSEN